MLSVIIIDTEPESESSYYRKEYIECYAVKDFALYIHKESLKLHNY